MDPDLPEEDHNRVYYYSVFPNMLLSLHPDYVMFHILWPVAETAQRSSATGSSTRNRFRSHVQHRRRDEFWDMTNRQDWHICEQSQPGIKSRAYVSGPYSRRESSRPRSTALRRWGMG